jgi:hypothetical protein
MTTKKPEIWRIVLQRFPNLPIERTCEIERRTRAAARESFYQRLDQEHSQAEDQERWITEQLNKYHAK